MATTLLPMVMRKRAGRPFCVRLFRYISKELAPIGRPWVTLAIDVATPIWK